MRDPAESREPSVRLESEPDAMRMVQQTTSGGLLEHDMEFAGDPDRAPLVLSARDNGGAVIAGLVGATGWRWLVIRLLWVQAGHRRRGIGRMLLRVAETEARRRRCVAALVETLDFQAPALYEREGYEMFGVLEGFPPGHRRLYFKKTFEVPTV